MKFCKIIPTILLFACSPYLVYANETGYEVELIIFEYSRSPQLESEDWSYNDMLNNEKDIAIARNDNHDSEFMMLDWNNGKLSDSLEKIQSNSKYNILIKKRWKQTGLDRESAYAIDITSLQKPVSDTAQEKNSDNQNLTIIKNNLKIVENDTAIKENYIEGRIKLIMSRYLHFEVNLNYYKLLNDSADKEYKMFPIVSERRMRSREIHYIDHPMIGIIVYAVPYTLNSTLDQNKIRSNLSGKSN